MNIRHSFISKFFFIFFLSLLSLSAWGQKTDPIVTLSDTVITIENLNKVPSSLLIPPSYTIKDASGKDITDDFDRTYYVEGSTLSSSTSSTSDAVSGTQVARTTGRLTIGDKANATGFKIVMYVTPIEGTDAEDEYNDVQVTYRVKILPITGTAVMADKKMYVGQVIEAPTLTITDQDGQNITDKYELKSLYVSNNGSNKDYVTWDKNGEYFYAKKVTEADSPVQLIYEYEGKSGYESTYMAITVNATLTVLPAPTGKITPTISVNPPYTVYVGSYDNVPTIKILDDNQNDISSLFDISISKVSSDNLVQYVKYWGESIGRFNAPNTNTGESVFKVTASPASYGILSRLWWFWYFGLTEDDLTNLYNSVTLDSFIVKVIKYPTELTIDPSVRNIPAGTNITSDYYPNLTFTDVKNKSQITSYRCYVDYQQTSDAIVEEKTINYWSRGFTDVTDEDGTKWRRTWFDSSESINNWGLKIKDNITEGRVTFRITAFKNGDAYYDSASATYTLQVGKITPLVSASDTAVVATLDQANSLPQIYVTDRSGNDISSYFDLTYTITSNGSGTTITSDGQLTLSGTGK
jgi:hypothetical protein